MEFFNNKNNDTLKFKINSEGVDINKIEPRLILTTEQNKNYLFIGEIQNDICKFNIPKLENFEKGDEGRVKFEIITEDMYFPVWEDNFEVKTKANIKVEEMINQIIKEDKSDKKTIKATLETNKKEEISIKKEEQPVKSSDNNNSIKHFGDFLNT